ncbi:D-alanyl-D-alanine carboxypeptidase/D-alanyl-D-alanine-endopeptidase [Synechococcus sp. CS-205]|uniref:D-alanyl-D-alanine carboxypeptidase/D-alanyl-D-alanine endopeptidase n=1 Tax=Synechococcus sp. CS-205 TaxID=2847984 RepID=UPI00223B994C|nr:D-alanyl-D-alanine carboxypeptidase/D-alanyl-D-alanine-endopeptidase [Synechococcus sp. CS-205]MCT0248750.1 D-alanyl-D-alanine carboxypeptidase/D-alanyl-D-alanine-endopeptidase [Synechococcus sp. CS-205]
MSLLSNAMVASSAAAAAAIGSLAFPALSAEVGPAPAPPAALARRLEAVTGKEMYRHSTWGWRVVEESSGAVLLERNSAQMFVPGSIMKTYSTAAVLKEYGADHRFRTPIHQLGTVRNGVLDGHLVLVGSGDFSFGLRERPDGSLGFNSLPRIDHNYASTGFPGVALLPDSDPLRALDQLAGQVRSGGIRRVRGDVAIDDRLFNTYSGWPDGLIAPIWVNENLLDITTRPGRPGEPALVDWRPRTTALSVVSQVTTVAEGTATEPLQVEPLDGGRVRISGRIAADAPPQISTAEIRRPADFARTALIEALERAGVAVDAPATGGNPAAILPAGSGAYAGAPKLAEHVSPPLSEFVKVILKISYNRGADLMVCLVAVKAGSRDCPDGLARELEVITALGVSPASTLVEDGAGSIDSSRTSPIDQTTLLRRLLQEPWGQALRQGLPVMGVDGTQAQNQVGTPAAGRIRLKDGSRVMGSASGQMSIPAKTQVGYIEAASGRRLVYALYLNNVPTSPAILLSSFETADRDLAAIAAAFQEAF